MGRARHQVWWPVSTLGSKAYIMLRLIVCGSALGLETSLPGTCTNTGGNVQGHEPLGPDLRQRRHRQPDHPGRGTSS